MADAGGPDQVPARLGVRRFGGISEIFFGAIGEEVAHQEIGGVAADFGGDGALGGRRGHDGLALDQPRGFAGGYPVGEAAEEIAAAAR